MKIIIFLSLMLAATYGFAQDNEAIYSGRWKTGPSGYTIIGYNNTEVRKYLIYSAAPPAEQGAYQLIVDGVAINAPFYSKSWAVVEGKNIAIKQAKPGKSYNGTWKVIQQPEIPSEKITWSSDVSQTNEVILMSLKTEQDFVFEFGFKDVNMNIGCENVTFTLFVDGVAVKDDKNNDLQFVLGNSVAGRGKTIVIKSKGVCTNPTTTIFGSLKLKKLVP